MSAHPGVAVGCAHALSWLVWRFYVGNASACKIYADALTAVSSSDRDPLKAISTITNEELNAACDGCMDAIKGILADELRKLKAGFLLMDEKSHCQNESAAKFQVFTMSCGHIEDFHKGLIGRIGCLFPLNKNNFYL